MKKGVRGLTAPPLANAGNNECIICTVSGADPAATITSSFSTISPPGTVTRSMSTPPKRSLKARCSRSVLGRTAVWVA